MKMSNVLITTGLNFEFSEQFRSVKIFLFDGGTSPEPESEAGVSLEEFLFLNKALEMLAMKKFQEKKEPMKVKMIIMEPSKPPTSPKKSKIYVDSLVLCDMVESCYI